MHPIQPEKSQGECFFFKIGKIFYVLKSFVKVLKHIGVCSFVQRIILYRIQIRSGTSGPLHGQEILLFRNDLYWPWRERIPGQ
jgi:hypothetical protein